MALASNLLVTSSLENSVKATPARIEASVRKAGTDSSVTVPALVTGHAPVREVNMWLFFCLLDLPAWFQQWASQHRCGLSPICVVVIVE